MHSTAHRSRTGEQTAGPAHGGLFAAKLRVPAIATDRVVRPRLHRLLDHGVRTGWVIVGAPAGTGKTQLVADWATRSDAAPHDVVWVTLDGQNRDATSFIRYVGAALASTRGGGFFARPARPPVGSEAEEIDLVAFQDAVDQLPGDVVLVLDDFHEVLNSPTEQLVRRIARYRATRVRLVVLTRVDPVLGQARAKLDGRLTVLGPAALALTIEETAALLGHSAPLITSELVRLIHEQTGGWVGLVRSIADHLRCSADGSGAIGNPTLSVASVDEYLLGEVYGPQPRRLRSFMLRSCVVDPICADLAAALTGAADPELRLDQLSRAGLITSVDHGSGHWFRWLPMFRTLLQRRLHGVNPDLENDLHRVAAQWLREHADPASAVQHASAAGDTGTAARLLAECWPNFVLRGEAPVVAELLERLPEAAVLGDAELATAAGFTAVADGDVDLALRLARRAVDLAANRPARSRSSVELLASVVRLYAATLTGAPPDADAHEHGLDLLDELDVPLTRADRDRRALLLLSLGRFESSRQRHDQAAEHLHKALASAETDHLPHLRLACEAELLDHDVHGGDLAAAEQRARTIVEAVAQHTRRDDHALTAAYLSLATIALLRDEPERAMRHLDDADGCMHPVDRVTRAHAGFLRMTALCALGNVVLADEELARLHDLGTGDRLPEWLTSLVQTADAESNACRGHAEAGLVRLEADRGAADGMPTILPRAVLEAELLVHLARPAEARDVLARRTDRTQRGPGYVAASVVDALAADAMGRHSEALAVLDDAVRHAAPQRLIRPFVAPGRGARPLLEELLDRGNAHESFLVETLTHMRPHWSDRVTPDSAQSPFFVEPLSSRELEVLQQLQGTLPTAEVAEDLHISVNTLRTHIKHINRKLGVSDRRDAVRRGRDLGLI